MNNLTTTYWKQDGLDEAELLHVDILKTLKHIFGGAHPDTLSSMHGLACTYWGQGRWDDATSLWMRALNVRKRVLSEEHSDTLTSMSNLALTYWGQARWDKAGSLCIWLQVLTQKSEFEYYAMPIHLLWLPVP